MNPKNLFNKMMTTIRKKGLLKTATLAVQLIYQRCFKPVPDESGLIFQVLNSIETKRVMVDVGAHLGGSLAPFARAGWRVHAFEPDDKNRAVLNEFILPFDQVTVDDRAVSAESSSSAVFYQSNESSGVSGLSSFLSSHEAAGTVKVTTLAEYAAEKGIEQVDFLKVDTEGFDLFVLQGTPWETFSPDVILCEFEDIKTKPLGYTFHELSSFLKDRGYAIIVSEWYPIKAYGGVHKWRCFSEYPCELHDENAWGNLIAVKPANIYDLILQQCKQWTFTTE